jgi:AcrR family transcriptional regulator
MEKLPRGRHNLSPEYVARNQRERLLTAVAECVADVGYEETTVALVSARASVSKSDYYKRFEGKDDCFAAAYDDNMERLRERIALACESNKDWPLRVRDALAALVEFLDAEPERAKLLLVEGLRGGPEIYDRFQESVQEYAERLGTGAPRPQDVASRPQDVAGRPQDVAGRSHDVASPHQDVARIDGPPSTLSGSPTSAPSGPSSVPSGSPSSVPTVTDEAVVGGVASLVSRRVRTTDDEALEAFLPELIEFALTPYVGAAEARRIGSQPMSGDGTK